MQKQKQKAPSKAKAGSLRVPIHMGGGGNNKLLERMLRSVGNCNGPVSSNPNRTEGRDFLFSPIKSHVLQKCTQPHKKKINF